MKNIDEAEDIILVHMTDFHIESENGIAAKRIKSVAGAIGRLIEGPCVVVFLLTGDIAFSGKVHEYEAAKRAFDHLRGELAKWQPSSICMVSCPGNHDCNFDAMPDAVRSALLSSLTSSGNGAGDIIRALEPTQEAYFSFAKDISSGGQSVINPVLAEVNVKTKGMLLKVLSINTAISSVKKERPGTLILPLGGGAAISKDSDLTIALAHHTLNWLTPQDSLNLSQWLDSNVDMVMLGHEHRLDEFNQARTRYGSSVDYHIGLPMEGKEAQCGFSCYKIEHGLNEIAKFDIKFDNESSSFNVEEIATHTLRKNDGKNRGTVRFSDSHVSFLGDPGAGFSHPRLNRQMFLSDIFVPPDFRKFRSEKPGASNTKGVASQDELLEKIYDDEGRYIIFGAEQSGKTSFAKCLIGGARTKKLIPIYLDGQLLKSLHKGEVRGWLNGAISRQFASDCSDKIVEMPPESVIVLVDNLHAIPGGADGIDNVVSFISAKSRRLVLLSADSPAVTIVASGASTDEIAYLKGAGLYELLPLGHRRRGELIRKWASLGRDPSEEADAVESEVRRTKALLDRMLGRNALPKYPIFVLVLLQQLEGLQKNQTLIANASHGYLFEALITQSIDRFVHCHEIGTVNDFLAELAYEIFQRDCAALSRLAVEHIVKRFLDGLVKINIDPLLSELMVAKVIIDDGGLIQFRYQYLYYYYLAKWICDNRDKEESTKILEKCVELIHTEQSSNVLVFISHMKHERIVIDRILPLIRELFADQELCNLEQYSGLSLRFRTPAQRAILLQGPARDVSDQTNQRQDEIDSHHRDEEQIQLDEGLKFNVMLKAISTLGQVLKSRASSIPPQTMIEIATEIIASSRRLMTFLYKITEEHAEAIVHVASDAFEKAFRINRSEAVAVANSMIGSIVAGIARACVGRASEAIGAFELEPLLARLEQDLTDPDSKLFLLVARIIEEKNYPKESVEDYVKGLKQSNILPISVLSMIVASRFYLDPPERYVRDSACALLGIDLKPLSSRLAKG
ncbi:MAG: STAND family AAA ATPase [Dyella sp.]|uniref:STAND family AAA ATPase n=1 Tax=Dyella sp. TaxID=1869338 RepID=UPI003F7F23E2